MDVKETKGQCVADLKKGDSFEFTGAKVPEGVCIEALHSLFPTILAMKYGADMPWVKEDKYITCCPDYENLVVFELRRERVD